MRILLSQRCLNRTGSGPRSDPPSRVGFSHARTSSGGRTEVSNVFAGARVARRRTRAVISTAAALTAAAALAAPAGAAGPLPHSIAVFYHRDFVQASGFNNGELVDITASRNGVVIGTATNVPAIDSAPGAGDGLVTVNHPGGSCWDTFTPDLRPGDVITAKTAATTDSTSVANVEITQPATNVAGTIVVKGFAADASGNPLPLDQIQQRLVAARPLPLFEKNNKRDMRAGANGSEGTLSYDPARPSNPNGINWTATYTGLSAQDLATAVAAESRMIWLGTSPTLVNPAGFTAEATFAEVGGDKPALPGPGDPTCPPLATNAVTSVDAAHTVNGKPAINIANQNGALTVSGVSNGASGALVSLTDSANKTITQTGSPPPATGAQTWSVTFPAADVKTLADGPVTASGSYSGSGGSITGTTLAIVKDLVAPAAPTASVPSGTYGVSQSVALDSPDPTATVHHTGDGSTPNAASATFNPVSITASQTLNAVAIDPAGNASVMARFAYTIASASGSSSGAAAAQRIPLLPVQPGASVLGAKATSRARPVVGGLRISVGKRHALRVSMRLGSGATVVRVRVLRASGGRALLTAMRPTHGGRVTLTLSGRALRGLKAGAYVLEARAGASRTALGAASRRAFRVS